MDYEPAGPRDIELRLNNGRLKKINELHSSYDPPIPNHSHMGQMATTFTYFKSRSPSGQGARKVTLTKYYSYHLMVTIASYICGFFSFWLMFSAKMKQNV